MAAHFDRDDEAGLGYSKFFSQAAEGKRTLAESLIQYQNRRGGRVVFQALSRPSKMAWDSPLAAFQEALEQEKTVRPKRILIYFNRITLQVNESLLSTHRMADGDPHLCDFLENKFLGSQVDTIRELSTWITKLQRVCSGLGNHIIDTEVAA